MGRGRGHMMARLTRAHCDARHHGPVHASSPLQGGSMQLRVAALIAGVAAVTSCQLDQAGRAVVSPTAPPPGSPGTITDLAVAAATPDSLTLSFTEVDDGTGRSASYDFRYDVAPMSWGSALSVTRGSCATPVPGTTIGAQHRCTVLGAHARDDLSVSGRRVPGNLESRRSLRRSIQRGRGTAVRVPPGPVRG